MPFAHLTLLASLGSDESRSRSSSTTGKATFHVWFKVPSEYALADRALLRRAESYRQVDRRVALAVAHDQCKFHLIAGRS